MGLKRWALLALLSASPLMAQSVQSVEDALGAQVEIPVAPQRVVSLSDNLLTLPLHELGLTPVGAVWQVYRPDGTEEIYGLLELFSVTGEEMGIAPVFTAAGVDVEKIRLLDPDLILGTEYEAHLAPILKPLAPVYLINAFTRDAFGLNGMRRLAHLIGRENELQVLEDDYEARITALREALPLQSDAPSFAVLVYTDQLWLFTGAGALIEVMDDLGYQQPDWVIEASQDSSAMPLSPEALPRLDIDLLLVVPRVSEPTEASIRASMDTVMPGWHLLFDQQDVLLLPSNSLLLATFAGAHAAIDAVADHFGVTRPPRG